MIYRRNKVKQLKLVTGEEIIAEIIEEDEYDVILRNVLQINFGEIDDGTRMWTFKYYMCYQDDPDRFILLKVDKIVTIASPVDMLVTQYENALNDMVEIEAEQPMNFFQDEESMRDSDGSNIIDFPTIH